MLFELIRARSRGRGRSEKRIIERPCLEPTPPPIQVAPDDTRRAAIRDLPMRERYSAVVDEMKSQHEIRVRKWRRSMSGCAWQVVYSDGHISRLIEAPYPRGPMSAAVFLHEVGHHAIGFHVYKPRCLEEFHAWRWSLEAMRHYGLNITPAVEKRMADSLRYAVAKAMRRGLKRLPVELEPYIPARFLSRAPVSGR